MNRRRSRRSASAGLAVALIGIGALAILIPSLTVPVGDPAITATTVPTPAHSATTATIDAVDAYTSCAEAWEALGRPVTAADDGFSPDFDADSDSIGCEDDPRTTTFNEASIEWRGIWNSAAQSANAFAAAATDAISDAAALLPPVAEEIADDIRGLLDGVSE